MTGLERLKARQREARRLMALYEAELAGLVHAEGAATSLSYSYDAEEQRAFDRGLTEGRAILTAYPATPEAVGAPAGMR